MEGNGVLLLFLLTRTSLRCRPPYVRIHVSYNPCIDYEDSRLIQHERVSNASVEASKASPFVCIVCIVCVCMCMYYVKTGKRCVLYSKLVFIMTNRLSYTFYRCTVYCITVVSGRT